MVYSDVMEEKMEQETATGIEQTWPTAGQENQASSPELRPGWLGPAVETLPRPTYWPVALALGVVFALGGIVTAYPVSLVGVLLIATAIAGWIGELRHEHTN
jgi:hypothetical protein